MLNVLDIETEPQVGAIFPVEIIAQNTSLKVEEINISLDHTEGFLFSGTKSFPCRILPFGTRVVNFNMVPLHAGKYQLPKISVASPSGVEKDVHFMVSQDSDVSGSSLSVTVFVKPANM